MLVGCRDSVRIERGHPHRAVPHSGLCNLPREGCCSTRDPSQREVTMGWGPDVALEVQRKDLACFLGSKKTSLQLATEWFPHV